METPREYQQAIFETAKKSNTLVVLPTGLGKSLIGVMLADDRLKSFPSGKILILAPTRPLVEQHYHYFKKHISGKYESHIFTGKINALKRAEIWKTAQIIFSTPQCIQFDLEAGRINLDSTVLLIEDEVHRCLKNYSYTYVAKKYIEQAKNARILGLTASPASDPKIIKEICQNLDIKEIEVRNRESTDVKPYLQKLTQEIIKLELPENFKEIRENFNELYKRKIEELKNRKLLFAPATKTNLIKLQAKLQGTVSKNPKSFNTLRGISVCAQAIKLQHAIEMLETQSIESCLNYVNDLFEQTKQGKSKGVKQITNSKEFNDAYLKLLKLQEAKIEHPKLEKLKQVMIQELKAKPELKAIIFAQYRDTINKINNMLLNQGLKSSPFIGQAKRKLDGMTQKEQQHILHNFKEGKLNCIIASSIGEEGLDIPEVNIIIFYEPIPSAIRTVQRRGRTARLKPGKLTILMTKGTRDESYYWSAFHKEKKMHKTLEKLKENLRGKSEKIQKSISEF